MWNLTDVGFSFCGITVQIQSICNFHPLKVVHLFSYSQTKVGMLVQLGYSLHRGFIQGLNKRMDPFFIKHVNRIICCGQSCQGNAQLQFRSKLFTPDGKINCKYSSETTAVPRLKGQQNAAVSEGEERRWREQERDSWRETWLDLHIVEGADSVEFHEKTHLWLTPKYWNRPE